MRKDGKVFVKPRPGGRVRDPFQSYSVLSKDGDWKKLNSYWLRRIKFGDVIECDPPKKQPELPKIGPVKKIEKED